MLRKAPILMPSWLSLIVFRIFAAESDDVAIEPDTTMLATTRATNPIPPPSAP